jgi:hypothetical protein
MPLKILCAGCPKDEREPAESAVKAALGHAAGSWTVSLVKIGPQWSVTVDGPEVKHKTMMVPHGGLRQAIQELVPSAPARAPAAPMPRAPLPPTKPPAVPVPRAAPVAPPPPARTPSPPATARSPSTPAGRAPAPPAGRAPSPAARVPSSSSRPGERQDRYDCQYCGGAFVVIYDASPGSGEETVAVACPHCWKNSHVMVAEGAALSRDYRAEKV